MRNGLLCVLLSLCCLNSTHAYIVDGARVQKPKLLAFAKNKLPNQGVIEQSEDGLTYLKLSPQYLEALLKQIPGYMSDENMIHICVIDQAEGKNIPNIQELGKIVSFKPLGFYKVVENDNEYFRLAVEAPDLNALRLKYGLSKHLEDKAFNFTIGVRKLDYRSELEP